MVSKLCWFYSTDLYHLTILNNNNNSNNNANNLLKLGSNFCYIAQSVRVPEE